MDDLARYLENWTDLPVVNRTALSGLFAVETEGWTPMGLPPPPPGGPPAAGFDDLPTIFTVLRKLGLELKQQKASVPVYTVAHIERPAGEWGNHDSTAPLLSLTEIGLQPGKKTGPHFRDEPNEEIFIVINVPRVDGML